MKPKRVLLVEDNPDDAALVLRFLKKGAVPCELDVAPGGEAALEALRAASQREHGLPDVVLVDLKMPGMDGIVLVQRIRADERLRQLPIVVFTSSNEPKDIADAYKAGASSFVRKPIESGEFAGTVQKMAEYWLRINEAPVGRQSTPILM